jgi:hypothetical protein
MERATKLIASEHSASIGSSQWIVGSSIRRAKSPVTSASSCRLRRNSASGKRMLNASSVAECIELNSTATMPFLDIAAIKSPSELLPHANRMLSRIAVAF